MHKVYSIKKKKYSKKYFVNFVDFTFDSIELDIDIISKYCITVDTELDDETIAEAKDIQQYKDVKLAAYNYVSYKPRSETEVRRKLEEKKFGINHIDFAINFLYEFKLLDDEDFSQNFIKSYLKRKPSSEQKLYYELSRKGVSEEIITSSLTKVYPSDMKLDIATKAAMSHLKKISHKPKDKQKKLLADFLARRGFNWETIKKVLPEIID